MNHPYVELFLPDELSTITVARQLVVLLKPPLLITFKGEIGAGKTCFIRAMLQHLGIQGAIKSPTYGLVESYSHEAYLIHHFDLYRLLDAEELDFIGFRDYFTPNSLVLVEWPERAQNVLTDCDIEINLKLCNKGRMLHISARSIMGERILALYQEG